MAGKTNINYAYELDSIIVCKFASLIGGIPLVADKINSINIVPQVAEISIFESLFEPAIRCEIAVLDHIGLMVNFPLSGEEAVIIRYKSLKDNKINTLYFIIDEVSDMQGDDQARAIGYVIKGVSIESYANAKQRVQQGYKDTMPNIAKQVFQDHIVNRLKKVFPTYVPPALFVEQTDNLPGIVVIPNIHPFAAISMLAEMAVNEAKTSCTYLFFQTLQSYNFITLQSLFEFSSRGSQRRRALEKKYAYISDIQDTNKVDAKFNGRIVSNLVINRRLSSFAKLADGYFHNNLFEINIAQKAVWGSPVFTESAKTIYENQLNTQTYSALAIVEDGDEQMSNRTKYVVTTQKENDNNYPVSRWRDKWGQDLIAHVSMDQVDLTVTIPGTSEFSPGDLFYLELPELHGFNDVSEDDLITGLFVVTEVKQLLHVGGFHTTVLRINKDSYNTSIDRKSRYGSK